MKEEYQRIFASFIKRYRKDNGISLRELSKITDIAHSHLSRMENGLRPIHDHIAAHIMKSLDIGTYDEAMTDRYKALFDAFYKDIVYKKMEDAKKRYQEIQDIKEDIEHSIYRYHLELYDLVYKTYFEKKITDEEMSNLMRDKEEGSYPKRDMQIIYDIIGVYYKDQRNIDKAMHYHDLAIDLDRSSIVAAMSAYHASRMAYQRKDLMLAHRYIQDALVIFQRENIRSRILQCKVIIGIIYSALNDDEKAIDVYLDVINEYTQNRYFDSILIVAHDLLHSYIRSKKYKEADDLLLLIEGYGLDTKDIETSLLILYYAFMRDDEEMFLKWYDRTFKDGTYPEAEALIELLHAIMIEDIDATKAEELVSKIDIPEEDLNDDEYKTMLDHIMIKVYRKHGLDHKALSIYEHHYDKIL